MTPEELAADNARRIGLLGERGVAVEGQDALRTLSYLEHLMDHLGIREAADHHHQEVLSACLDRLEAQVGRALLLGGGPGPMSRPPGSSPNGH